MTPNTGRFDYLDGLRAVAIGAVLALHWLSWYFPLFHGGSIGVDVFFVLSGFIITTMLWRTAAGSTVLEGWLSFVRRRVIRLYPALLGLVVASTLLFAVAPFAPLQTGVVVKRGVLVLGQSSALWAAGQHGSLWLPRLQPFGQAWSLAIEWYFYLLWPLVVLTARARSWRPRRLATASISTAAGLYLVALPQDVFWFYFGPTARFAEILTGCALALWFQAGAVPALTPRVARPLSVASLGAVGAYTLFAPAATSLVYRWLGIPLTVLATVVLIHAGYHGSAGPVHRLLSHPWVSGVGRVSYSLYLWHVVPLLLLQNAWPAAPKPVLGLTVVAATVVLTAASYRYLERPCLRPRSDVLSPARRGAAAPAGDRTEITPRPESSVSSSSAAARVRFNPMRSAARARRSAPTAPSASRSARNSRKPG